MQCVCVCCCALLMFSQQCFAHPSGPVQIEHVVIRFGLQVVAIVIELHDVPLAGNGITTAFALRAV